VYELKRICLSKKQSIREVIMKSGMGSVAGMAFLASLAIAGLVFGLTSCGPCDLEPAKEDVEFYSPIFETESGEMYLAGEFGTKFFAGDMPRCIYVRNDKGEEYRFALDEIVNYGSGDLIPFE